jgi:hypothetical protein
MMPNEANYGSKSGFVLRPGYYANKRPATEQQTIAVNNAVKGIKLGIADLNAYGTNLTKIMQKGGYRIIYFEDYFPAFVRGQTIFPEGETDSCSGTIYGTKAASGDTAHFVIPGRTSPNGTFWQYHDTETATVHEFGHALDDLLGENYGADHLHLSDAFTAALGMDIGAYKREEHTEDENQSFDFLTEFGNGIDHWKELAATMISSLVEANIGNGNLPQRGYTLSTPNEFISIYSNTAALISFALQNADARFPSSPNDYDHNKDCNKPHAVVHLVDLFSKEIQGTANLPTYDPLLIDLDGDGIKTLFLEHGS